MSMKEKDMGYSNSCRETILVHRFCEFRRNVDKLKTLRIKSLNQADTNNLSLPFLLTFLEQWLQW